MIPLQSARDRVLAQCPPLHPRAVPVLEALGCVTSVALEAHEPIPAFDNTAVDGFAVRADDTGAATDAAPVRLRVTATLAAGASVTRPTGPGEAVRIMTGAPLPPGADAVVMVEDTDTADGGSVVLVRRAARRGDHVRRAGEDLPCGQEVFGPFTVLEPAHLGVLASLGLRKAPVFPRPRVAVLSTGDELVEGPEPLAPGQVRDANRYTLLAMVLQAGCVPVDLGLVRDDEAALSAALRRGLADCDAVVTSGGVSVGEFDYVKAVLDRLSGGRMASMQVAIRPAKPLAFGTVGGKPVFGLPGNPVSSMVSFELFARPALRQMMGHRRLDRLTVAAVADERLVRRPDGKLHFVRVVASYQDSDARFHLRSAGGQQSHQLRAAATANALAILPDGRGADPGAEVQTMLLTSP